MEGVSRQSEGSEERIMSLTSDDLIKIQVQWQNGQEPSIKGKEADDFREELKKAQEEADRDGYILDVPHEW